MSIWRQQQKKPLELAAILVVREAISTKDLFKKHEQLFIILCFFVFGLSQHAAEQNTKIRMKKGRKKNFSDMSANW